MVLLREELMRFEQNQEEGDHLYRSALDLREMMVSYYPELHDEKKVHRQISALITKFEEWGILKKGCKKPKRSNPFYALHENTAKSCQQMNHYFGIWSKMPKSNPHWAMYKNYLRNMAARRFKFLGNITMR